MKELFFTSISLLILSGCQDSNVIHETKGSTDKRIDLSIDNHHVPIIKTCDCNR